MSKYGTGPTHRQTKQARLRDGCAPKFFVSLPKFGAPKFGAPKFWAPKFPAPKFPAPKFRAPKNLAPKFPAPKVQAPKLLMDRTSYILKLFVLY